MSRRNRSGSRKRSAGKPFRRIVDARLVAGVLTLYLECGHDMVRPDDLTPDQTVVRCEGCKADTIARRKAARAKP